MNLSNSLDCHKARSPGQGNSGITRCKYADGNVLNVSTKVRQSSGVSNADTVAFANAAEAICRNEGTWPFGSEGPIVLSCVFIFLRNLSYLSVLDDVENDDDRDAVSTCSCKAPNISEITLLRVSSSDSPCLGDIISFMKSC